MAKINDYSNGKERLISAWNDAGDKRYGFLSKDRSWEDPRKTRYGFGLDNILDPYGGVSDNEIKTLLGTIDYGRDGDTIGAGFTPNFFAGRRETTPMTEGGSYVGYDNGNVGAQAGTYETPQGNVGVYLDALGQTLADAGIWGNKGARSMGLYAAPLGTRDYGKTSYGELDTPLGMFGYGRDNGGVLADFTPDNQAYMQAIINLLRGR